MAVTATQSPVVVSSSGQESELQWSYFTDPAEFRSRPPRRGEVRVLDRSAVIKEQRLIREAFLAAQAKR